MLQTALNIAISLSILGLVYKFFFFIRKNRPFKGGKRVTHGLSIKNFFLNTFFQTKLFKAAKLRWVMHFLVAAGFFYLLIFHALDDVTSSYWFPYYEPTVDPFQLLRNLAGLFVLIGCLGFLYRRIYFFKTLLKKKLQYKGLFSILMILMMIVSGFLLEGLKIISEPRFIEMVEEYSDINGSPDLEDLKIYWEKQYHVVFNETFAITKEKLANGNDLNETYCMDCHSPVQSAFISRTIAKSFKKTGVFLNLHRADNVLYYVHFFLSLLILVTWPFSRFFHILLIPLASLEKNLKKEQLYPEKGVINTASLFACTNCGLCSDVCNVFPNFLINKNVDTLPHSKIESFKKVLDHGSYDPETLYRLQSGNGQCTYCHKCTDICPSGIDLQNLWGILNQMLALKGFVNNDTFIKGLSLKQWTALEPKYEKITARHEKTLPLADNVDSFENCIQCTICTNVCPVVEYDPAHNDYTPQQVMNLLRLGKKHLATGTRMVWNCLTCFSCQEHCPQGIRVADIMLELKNNGNYRADAIRLENLTDRKAG